MNREEIRNIFGKERLLKVLSEWYMDEKKSTSDIEEAFKKVYDIDVTSNVVYLLLKEFDIPMRDISESVSLATRSLDYSKGIFEDNPIAFETMEGLIISDGTISNTDGQTYHRFSISSTQEEFMTYCRKNLLCFNPSDIDYNIAFGYSRNKGYEKRMYGFNTSFHPDITKQRIRWYINGKKIIPKDIKITPLMLKMWYYGDGTIINNKVSNTCVLRLSTDGFTRQEVDFLIEQLKIQAGINSVNADGRIRLRTESIPVFFSYIGKKSDISCYSYKFDIDEWRFLKSMKAAAIDLNISYSRLSHLVKTKSIEFNRSPGGKKVFFTEAQMEKLKKLHSAGILESDARVNSASVTKGCFKRKPDVEQKYKEIVNLGFPYIKLSDAEKVIMFNRLNNIPTISIQNNEILSSYRDNDLPSFYHPHIYNVRTGDNKTPLESFNSKDDLMNVIEKFMSKNIEFSPQNLRYEICRAEKTKRTSLFPVRVAKTLFTLYGKDGMSCLDPCSGYGSRLVGFYTNARCGTYDGIEPCKETYDGLINTKVELENMTNGHTAEIYNGCAEDIMPSLKKEYDLIFTSPPYFNLEKYSKEETQSYLKYPKYEDWLNNFLFVIIKEGHRLLKQDGVFLLNIADCNNYKIVEHAELFIKKMFRIETVLIMVSPSKYKDYFAEPIFVLRKE